MYSRSHLLVSLVLGAAVAVLVGAPVGRGALLVGYAGVLGVGIDADHFLIARLRTGDWHNLRYAVSNPDAVVLDQDRLFEEGDVGTLTRLLSHALLAGALVLGLVLLAVPVLAVASAVVLYGHVVCDLVAGVRRYEPR